MGNVVTHQQDGRPRRAGGPAFDLVASKLGHPSVRQGRCAVRC